MASPTEPIALVRPAQPPREPDSPSHARPDLRVAPPPGSASRPPPQAAGLYAAVGKRWLDLLLTLATLPVWGSATLLLLLAVRLDPRSGPAPALFRQTRVGRGGRPFTCWKIRTMAPGAEALLARRLAQDPAAAEEWSSRQKLADDPRVLPLGRLLRAASLDELPQLWNVLRGEMSLVGPRPFTPEQRRLYPTPETYEAMRPGLTGPWQVGPRGAGGDFAGRAVEDARYLRDLSLAGDLGLLLRTVGVVARAEGE